MGKHFDVKPKYFGAPSFTYEFETSNGIFVVDQAGKVTNPEANEVELKSLLSGAPIMGVTDPSAPSDPVDTGAPEAPVDPSESKAPNELVSSDEPESPAAPDHQIPQESPVEADAPSDHVPSAEVDSAPPVEIVAPVDPDVPAEHDTSAEPESSAEPAAPSDQANPNITDLEITVPMGSYRTYLAKLGEPDLQSPSSYCRKHSATMGTLSRRYRRGDPRTDYRHQ